MSRPTFEEWMREVDAELNRLLFLDSGDLPDWNYRDAYDSGEDAVDVAQEVYSENLEEMGF
jgi:hypothetical protein